MEIVEHRGRKPPGKENKMLYYANELLKIEKELVVGDEKDLAPKTLESIRKLSSRMFREINEEEERKMIEKAI